MKRKVAATAAGAATDDEATENDDVQQEEKYTLLLRTMMLSHSFEVRRRFGQEEEPVSPISKSHRTLERKCERVRKSNRPSAARRGQWCWPQEASGSFLNVARTENRLTAASIYGCWQLNLTENAK